MKSSMPLRAVVYQRVSTDRQADEGISLDAQEALAKKRCEDQGWTLVRTYTDVGSGRSNRRPAFKEMLSDAERKQFDVVVVYNTDRMARSTLGALQAVARLQDVGVALVSLTENLDLTSDSGRAMFGVSAIFAELESAKIGKRVKDAMRHRAISGGTGVGLPPDGYARAEDRSFVVDPARAPIVREIFSLYLAGGSLRSISESLNARGMLTRKGKTWHSDCIKDILANPAYTGSLVYGKHTVKRTSNGTPRRYDVPPEEWIWTEDAHEAIITRQEFDAAQGRMHSRRGVSPATLGAQAKSPWVGLVKCGGCDYSYGFIADTWRKGKQSGSHPHFRCGSYLRRGKSACPDSKMVYEGSLERYGLPALDHALLTYFSPATDKAKLPVARLRRGPTKEQRIASIEAAIAREADIYRAGAQSLDAMSGAVKKLRAQLAELQSDDAQTTPITIEPPRFSGSLPDLWARLTIRGRGELLQSLIEKVVVYPDRCEAIPLEGLRWCLGEAIVFRRSARTPQQEAIGLSIS